MKKRVLWIEDDALEDLVYLAAPLYTSREYDLTIARDATEGCERALLGDFDVYVVDIRIPPGEDARWIKIWDEAARDKVMARLGLRVLKFLLSEVPVDPGTHPKWRDPRRFAVLTVEGKSEVLGELESLHVTACIEKSASMPHETLVDLVKNVVAALDVSPSAIQ